MCVDIEQEWQRYTVFVLNRVIYFDIFWALIVCSGLRSIERPVEIASVLDEWVAAEISPYTNI